MMHCQKMVVVPVSEMLNMLLRENKYKKYRRILIRKVSNSKSSILTSYFSPGIY